MIFPSAVGRIVKNVADNAFHFLINMKFWRHHSSTYDNGMQDHLFVALKMHKCCKITKLKLFATAIDKGAERDTRHTTDLLPRPQRTIA